MEKLSSGKNFLSGEAKRNRFPGCPRAHPRSEKIVLRREPFCYPPCPRTRFETSVQQTGTDSNHQFREICLLFPKESRRTTVMSHSDRHSYPLPTVEGVTPRGEVSLHSSVSVPIISRGVRSRQAGFKPCYSVDLFKHRFGGNALCVAGLLIKVLPSR